jgi:hypothetical protein
MATRIHKMSDAELQARGTANYLRTILASALGYERATTPVDLVNDHGTESRGTLRVEVVLTSEDAQKLATMLNRVDIRTTLCPCLQRLGCLCAFHAGGGNADDPCSAVEHKWKKKDRLRLTRNCELGNVGEIAVVVDIDGPYMTLAWPDRTDGYRFTTNTGRDYKYVEAAP